MKDWEKRQHRKRKDYAPKVEWIVGEWKHGEPTMKACFNLELEEAFALRDFADDQGVHLSDVLVDALQVGAVGLDDVDARHGLEERRVTAETRRKEAVRLEREARDHSVDMELRWIRMRRRQRALHAWGSQVRHHVLTPQEREELRVLDERNREHIVPRVDVDGIPVDLGHQVHAMEGGAPDVPQAIGERLPVSLHEDLVAERVEAVRKGHDVTLSDVVRMRVRRFLQLHGRDPVVRRVTVQIREARHKTAASRARRRHYLRLARVWQIRRQRMKRRLEFIVQFRARARRVPTPGERLAFEEHEEDPDALDVEDELQRRETMARQQVAAAAGLRSHPAAA